MLLVTDSCQAESMGSKVYSPNVITVGSSQIGEDSLAVFNEEYYNKLF